LQAKIIENSPQNITKIQKSYSYMIPPWTYNMSWFRKIY